MSSKAYCIDDDFITHNGEVYFKDWDAQDRWRETAPSFFEEEGSDELSDLQYLYNHGVKTRTQYAEQRKEDVKKYFKDVSDLKIFEFEIYCEGLFTYKMDGFGVFIFFTIKPSAYVEKNMSINDIIEQSGDKYFDFDICS